MAKTSAIEKDRNRRKLVEKYTRDRAELRAMARDRKRPPDERFEATLALAKLPRNGAKVRVRNRCAMTGRPRAVYRKFGLSRIALRELASNGQIPGMIKASW